MRVCVCVCVAVNGLKNQKSIVFLDKSNTSVFRKMSGSAVGEQVWNGIVVHFGLLDGGVLCAGISSVIGGGGCAVSWSDSENTGQIGLLDRTMVQFGDGFFQHKPLALFAF